VDIAGTGVGLAIGYLGRLVGLHLHPKWLTA